MGKQEDIIAPEEGLMDLRLLLEDVEGREPQGSILEGIRDAGLVDESSACGIYEQSPGFHGEEAFSGQEMMRFLSEGSVQADYVAGG